jgi:hypothetical protein
MCFAVLLLLFCMIAFRRASVFGSKRRTPIALYVTILSLGDHGGFLLFQLLMKPGKELKARSFKLLKNWPR